MYLLSYAKGGQDCAALLALAQSCQTLFKLKDIADLILKERKAQEEPAPEVRSELSYKC